MPRSATEVISSWGLPEGGRSVEVSPEERSGWKFISATLQAAAKYRPAEVVEKIVEKDVVVEKLVERVVDTGVTDDDIANPSPATHIISTLLKAGETVYQGVLVLKPVF